MTKAVHLLIGLFMTDKSCSFGLPIQETYPLDSLYSSQYTLLFTPSVLCTVECLDGVVHTAVNFCLHREFLAQ